MDLSQFQDKGVLEFLQTLNAMQDEFKGLSGRVIDREMVKDLFHFMKQRFAHSFVAASESDKNSNSTVLIKEEFDEPNTDGYLIEIKKEVDENGERIGHLRSKIPPDTVSIKESVNEQTNSNVCIKVEFDSSTDDDDYLIEIKKEVNDNGDKTGQHRAIINTETNSLNESDTEQTGDVMDGNYELSDDSENEPEGNVQEDRPHKCSVCDLCFKRANHLKRHFDRKHSTARPFSCEETNCGKTFKTKTDLSSHKRFVHQGDRPHQCNQSGCGLSFVTKHDLFNHQRTHTGERPYRCSVDGCEMAFKLSSHLTTHKRIHSNDRPFKCTEDGCEKAFKRAGDITTHMRTHTNDRPFKCTVTGCDKSYKHSSQLTYHLCTHNGEKYHCQVNGCQSKYTRMGDLRRHYKSRHSDQTPPTTKDSQRSTTTTAADNQVPNKEPKPWEIKEESDDECQLIMPQVYKTTKQFI